ncbi:hypothetical protein MBANPS3_010158 [Mucor bainieri]
MAAKHLKLMYDWSPRIRRPKDGRSIMAEAFDGSRFPSKTIRILSSNKSKTALFMTPEEAEALANQFLAPYLSETAPVQPGQPFTTHFSTLQHYKNQAIRARIPLYCTDDLEYQEQHLPIDPYWLGLWLGDGARDGPAVFLYDEDPAVVELCGEQPIPPRRDAPNFEFYIPDPVNSNQNKLYQELINWNTVAGFDNDLKHVPTIYMENSTRNRLRLLAGFLDADGHYHAHDHNLEFTQSVRRHQQLFFDIMHLARGLGFYVPGETQKKAEAAHGTQVDTFTTRISGYVEVIPCLLQRKKPRQREKGKDPRFFTVLNWAEAE